MKKIAEVLESPRILYVLIGLLILEMSVTFVELILSMVYEHHKPHALHTVEHVFWGLSLTITTIFCIEILLRVLLNKRYLLYPLNAFDAFVAYTSLVLYIIFPTFQAQSLAGFMITLRGWKLIKMGMSITQAMHLRQEHKVAALEKENQGLKQQVMELKMRIERIV